MFAAYRPGEEFGNAMVNLLTGAVSPSGKLAQSWPRAVGQVRALRLDEPPTWTAKDSLAGWMDGRLDGWMDE